ncbi:MAG TPA: hypothetical protein VJR48_17590, partial [Ktedonobacterales bacterium]|nr:hypothetical protein [Ktedonobacterales bacterium]
AVPSGAQIGAHRYYGGVKPVIGGPATTFTFSIIYTLPTTPAIHNVTIDGTDYPMTSQGAVTGGTAYQYSTTLGVGTHHYSFTFSDTVGTVTLPFNTAMPGPEVHPFTLTNMKAVATVLPGKRMRFSITYISPANLPPTLADVDIDGVPHALKSNGTTTWQTGVTFSYSTRALAVGLHYYRFRFDDGSGVAIYPGGEAPAVTPITLTKSGVSPTSGTTSTVFTFQTTYTDASGAAPTQASLYVDGVSHAIAYVSGAYTTGAIYQASLTLGAGSHTFFFVFSDAQSSWANPFAPNAFKGPNVGANAQPVPPGTIVGPSHDQDPDQLQSSADGDG